MICLTFDTDHMSEARMRAWLDGCRFPGAGTFFCTEAFHFLAEAGHETAPHPYLGDKSDWAAELKKFRAMFPRATCWRAHSLVFSQYVGVQIGEKGLGYRIVSTVDAFARGDVMPFLVPWGVWQMPIYYMDNNDFERPRYGTTGEYGVFDRRFIEMAVEGTAAGRGVYVFDFHPIHYELNTPNYEYYVSKSADFKAGAAIETLRYDGYGVRNFFDDLVAAMTARGLVSLALPDALDRWRELHGGAHYRLS